MKYRGFSLVEILLVLAILAILLTVGILNYISWRTRSMVREAASEIVQNVERVRSEAKRLNATRRLYVATGSDYSMRDSSGNVISPFSVLPGVTIVRISQSQSTTNLGSATMDFKAPYGTRDTPAVSYDIIVQAASNNTVTRTIRIIGPLGKVYVL